MNNQEQYLRELKKLFWENSLNPDVYQLERLAHFASLVVEKNEKVNLISRRDIKNIIENHIFLSSYISEYLPEKVFKFLDIGTGGGFPGIPLAITRPLLKGVLADSTTKKVEAVQDFVHRLKLSNIIAENGRVESDEFREKHAHSFDLIVSRAAVPLIVLLRYSLPLIKDKASLAAIKGGTLDSEFNTAKIKYRSHIKKSTVFELSYKPTNIRNQKGKKLILLELSK